MSGFARLGDGGGEVDDAAAASGAPAEGPAGQRRASDADDGATRGRRGTGRAGCCAALRGEWGEVARQQVAMALPISITYVSGYGLSLISVLFVGQLGAADLAASSLAAMLTNVTGFSVAIGLLTGLDTLGAQAFGAQQLARVGYVVQRALLIVTAFIVPVSVLWWFTTPALVALKQPQEVAEMAGQFTRLLIPGAPALLWSEVAKRFLSSQGIVRPMLYVSLAVNALHPLWCWLFIFHFDWGFAGAAIAMDVSYFLLCALILLYILIFAPHAQGTWPGWRWKEACSGWGEFLRLGVPGAAMLSLEWWAFELCVLVAGSLGTLPLAAHNVLATLVVVSFMLPLGQSVAAGTLVGQYLGAGDTKRARKVASLGICLGTGVQLVVVTVYLALGRLIPRAFTDNRAVDDAATELLPIVVVFIVLDSVQGIAQGVLRGAGKQRLGAGITIFAYWCISLPAAVLLTHTAGLGLHGLWWGFTSGYIVVCCIYYFVLSRRLDWEGASAVARKRALADSSVAGDGAEVELIVADGDGHDEEEAMDEPRL